ncbi:MAG: orotate phosphoribosyltransferase-like protein [Methanobacteriota archaeon]|nr:MAG: orotate phosphoribosyltransferase-like protein [Euryarchaeota archaeon]|tara:strand:+ start:2063 stop:2662 length:600 start_codon:yes stop_codon:yes gene_type:complete
MSLSIDELRNTVTKYKQQGLSTEQIADELSLSQSTILWLLTSSSNESVTDDRPADIRIGWRTIGARPTRVAALSAIFADVVLEEMEWDVDSVDTIVGISINGILFAHEIASQLNLDVAIHRDSKGPEGGHLSTKYGQVGGKRVVVVDDVLSTGATIKNTISVLKKMGADVLLALVLVNKTQLNEIEGVPLRGLIRTVTV